MQKQIVWGCGLAILLCCETSTAFGQTAGSSLDIPLHYVFDSSSHAARLSINIGINGGAPRPYLFDTGSSLFNAPFDPKTWGHEYSSYTSSVPSSSLGAIGTGIQLCYSTKDGCRGYTGNIL